MSSCPFLVEDTDFARSAPLLTKIVSQLSENANKFDHIMAVLVALMAQNSYHVTSLHECKTCSGNNAKTCVSANWKRPRTNVYEVNFSQLVFGKCKMDCRLIGIPTGDWMLFNLVPKGTSSACATRSAVFNVSKYVNLHLKELGKFWHLKELADKFNSQLFLPVHSEMLLAAGIASPCLQGIPEEARQIIFKFLNPESQRNLEIALNNKSETS